MYIAVIGAGPAGVVSLKKCVDDGHKCVIFEQMGYIGGTWYYSENADTDENGVRIPSGAYYGLRTNFPKELMELEDLPGDKYNVPYSYVRHQDVLKYINRYVEEFDLQKYIKLCHQVVNVNLIENEKWNVSIKNTVNKYIEDNVFDAVLICTGIHSIPTIPQIQGLDTFTGSIIHSHKFRRIDPYKHRNVLLIGCGISGLQISKLVAEVAEKVFLTGRYDNNKVIFEIPDKVKEVPVLKAIYRNKVEFVDGSEEHIDDIILCTGYQYSFPFLSPECGISIENKWIKYLYKHIINVEHPTMAFIGIPDRVPKFPLFGLQVRFFLALLKGQFTVNKEEMLAEVLAEEKRIMNLNRKPHHPHNVGVDWSTYIKDLATTANIENTILPVTEKLFEFVTFLGYVDIDDLYEISNDEEFAHIKSSSTKTLIDKNKL